MRRMNPVVHFEMASEDAHRMAEFYSKAFGWQTQMLGEDMGNYTLVTTGETDNNGMPKNLGTINGGFYPKKQDDPAQHPNIVIAVEDINESMKNIIDLGGRILGEPVDIPGYGTSVSFYDTEGNRVSVIQPLKEMIPANKD